MSITESELLTSITRPLAWHLLPFQQIVTELLDADLDLSAFWRGNKASCTARRWGCLTKSVRLASWTWIVRRGPPLRGICDGLKRPPVGRHSTTKRPEDCRSAGKHFQAGRHRQQRNSDRLRPIPSTTPSSAGPATAPCSCSVTRLPGQRDDWWGGPPRRSASGWPCLHDRACRPARSSADRDRPRLAGDQRSFGLPERRGRPPPLPGLSKRSAVNRPASPHRGTGAEDCRLE